MVDIHSGLLENLHRKDILNVEHIQLLTKPNNCNAESQLLEIISAMSDEKIQTFLKCLEEDSQQHVSNYIRSHGNRNPQHGDNWPLIDSIEIDNIHRNWLTLAELLDCEHGLVDSMFRCKLVSRQCKEFIEEIPTRVRINERILSKLNQISIADLRERFTSCLRETKQEHLIPIILPDVEASEQPMTDDQKEIWKKLYTNVENLDTRGGLVDEVSAKKCITRRQHEAIVAQITPTNQACYLMKIMSRCSKSEFNRFLECLETNGQGHLISDQRRES